MKGRLLAALIACCALFPAGAGAAAGPLTNYPVARGGFAIAVPSNWVDLTSTTPTAGANGKVPTMAEIAVAATKDGSRKLVAADPQAKGNVYLDVDVERIGSVSAATAAAATEGAIKKVVGKRGTVSLTPVKLGTNNAYQLHFVYAQQKGGTFESDEYLLVSDQIEYLILYVAPKARWASYSPLFQRSAASFHLLSPPKLQNVVLTTSQVGTGYKSSLIPGGNSFIGEVTLDLCAGTYPSESLRTGRLQLRYVRTKTAVSVSNEVVTYVQGGAQEALREVRSVAQSCAHKPVVLKQGKLKNVLTVTPIKDAKLLPGFVAVRITVKASIGPHEKTTRGVAIYQVKNNTLSGVYAWTTPSTTIDQAQKIGLHAAEQSAHNLGGLVLSA